MCDFRLSVTEILHQEYRCHKDNKIEGLKCMKKQLSGDEILGWTIETFSKFYPKTWYQKHCLPVLHLLPILVTVCFFFLDYYSDISLAFGYYKNSQFALALRQDYNSTSASADRNTSCSDPEMTPWDFGTAFIVSFICLLMSIFFTTPIGYQIINQASLNNERPAAVAQQSNFQKCLWKGFALIMSICISPFLVIYAAFKLLWANYKHKGAAQKVLHREELQNFEYLWGVLRTIEAGIESSGQLVLQVWLLSFQIQTIIDMNFFTFVEKMVKGLLFFFSFSQIPADGIEQSLGKLAMSTITLVLGVTSCYKTLKRGALSSSDTIFVAVSIILQVITRIFSLMMYFVTIPRKHAFEFLFIATHFILLGIFRTIVELKIFSRKRRPTRKKFDWAVFIINIFASGLVFVRIKRVGQRGSSFVLHAGYWLLALVENLILVCMPYIYMNESGTNQVLNCLSRWVLNAYIGIVVVQSLLSAMSYFIYYKCKGHPWNDINGPDLRRKSLRKSGRKKIIKYA